MRLLSIHLEHFKGIRDFILSPQGRDIEVWGANATGKTTLADAFWWLLFGKDTAGRADFQILPLGPDGKRVSEITEASVEAVLAYDGGGIHDGKQVTLKRVFAEKWTKKRGRSEAEMAGRETSYFINGVPTKAGEYQTFMRGLADEEQFKLLTNPRYFNEILDWKKRRAIISGMGQGLTDADVIASDPDLGPLSGLLNGKTVEDFRKVVDAEIKKTNAELDKLPVRIDEATRSIPEAVKVDFDLSGLRQKRTDQASLLAQMDSGGGVAEKTKAIREIEGQITDLDNKYRQAVGREISEAQEKLDKANSEGRQCESEIAAAQREIDQANRDIKTHQESVNKLASEWEQATALVFTHTDVLTCYACDAPLAPEKVQTARAKAEADFNLAKSKKIESIEWWGSEAQKQLKAAQGAHAKASYTKEQAGTKLATLNGEHLNLVDAVNAAKAKQNQPSSDPLRHQLADKLIALKEQARELQAGQVNPEKKRLEADIAKYDELIAETEKAIATNERRQTGLQRIDELKAQQKTLGKTFEVLEHERSLCEKFIVAKTALVTAAVNQQFKLARFKLFDVQINGGISETCEVTVDGVPYSDLNNAARINVGLDIIQTLGEVYDLTAPIFVDNAEAVCELVKTRAQQIRLYVSAKDATLRVEG